MKKREFHLNGLGRVYASRFINADGNLIENMGLADSAVSHSTFSKSCFLNKNIIIHEYHDVNLNGDNTEHFFINKIVKLNPKFINIVSNPR